jgi:O-antigen/teichoic acid export membrane protein
MDIVEPIPAQDEIAQHQAAVSTDETKRHFARNTISSIGFVLFNVATSFVMVPFLIAHLGVANYGMIYLATQFATYSQVLTIVVVGTISRFVTYEVSRGNMKSAQGYFNTQFIAILWLIAILLPVTALISYLTPRFLSIPPGQERNTQILFICVNAGFLLAMLSSAFQVSTFVRQRLDIKNSIEIVNQTVRYSTWIILFAVMAPAIWQVGLGLFAGVCVSTVIAWLAFCKLAPELRPRLRGFSTSRFVDMTRMGAWMSAGQMGSMLYFSMDPLIINLALGSTSTGKYGAIAGIAAAFRVLSCTMMGMMAPPAIACCARRDWDGLMRGTERAVRIQSLGMAIMTGLICGLAAPFLTRWLKDPQFADLKLLVWLLIGPMAFHMGMELLFSITYATNRLVGPGLFGIGGGVFRLLLALALIRWTGWGIYGLAVADLVSVSIKNLIFAPLYVRHILNRSVLPLYKAILPAIVVFGVAFGGSWELSQHVNMATYPRLGASGLLFGAALAVLAYRFGLSKDDRRLLRDIMPFGKGGKA